MDEKAQASQVSTEPARKGGRADRFRQRPKVDPIADLAQFGYVGQRRDESEESVEGTLPAWHQQFQLVPIDTIRPSIFQVRMVEDKESDEQLRQQIKEDLATHETLQHVFVVVPDQEDSSYYNPKMGGHRRLKQAKALGVQNVYIWIEEYNQEELARGTYAENDSGTRQALSLVEEGEFFRRVQQRLDWTQTEIAERFHVLGGQPHVARAIKAVSYPEDLRQMLFKDPVRGMRAAEILVKLDEIVGPEKAIEVRAPLIAAFNARELTTDALQIAVNRYQGKTLPGTISLPGKPLPPSEETLAPLSIEEMQVLEQARRVSKSVERFEKEIGEAKPSTEAREMLLLTRQRIDAILERQ